MTDIKPLNIMTREKCHNGNTKTNEVVAIDFGGFTFNNVINGAITIPYLSSYVKK